MDTEKKWKPLLVNDMSGNKFNMHDEADLLRLMEMNKWNGSQASRSLGMSKHYVRNYLRIHGMVDKVQAARKLSLHKRGLSAPVPTDSDFARSAESHHRSLLRHRRDAQSEDPKELIERLGRDTINDALISTFGIVRDAAAMLQVKSALLLKIVAADEDFMAAAVQGEKEMRLDMRDKMLLAAQGRIVLTGMESQWMERLARWDRMEGRGLTSDDPAGFMDGMPEGDLEVGEADLPDFSVPASVLGAGQGTLN